MKVSAGNHIPGLDGLRALAVLLVYVEHKVMVGSFKFGSLGVMIFFCLSGFLIIGILHSQRLRIEASATDFFAEMTSFWEKRVRRIFPIYYAVVALLVARSLYLGHGVTADGLVPWYVLLSPNIYIGWISREWTFFTHLWSIGVEQHFYMLISPLLLLVPSTLHRKLLSALFAGSVGFLLVRYALGADPLSLYVSSLCNFFLMASGGLLAIRRKPSGSGSLDGAACVAALVLLALVLRPPSWLGVEVGASLERLLYFVLGFFISFCTLRLVILRPSSTFVAFLELAPIRYLGTISYGFYVYHTLIPRFDRVLPGVPVAGTIALHFAACVGLSAISWHWFEKRLLRRKPPLSVGLVERSA